jgi:hypothetical protein
MDGTNGAWMLKSYEVAHYTIASDDNEEFAVSNCECLFLQTALKKVALL